MEITVMEIEREDGILYLCRKDIEQICRGVDSVAVMREVFSKHVSSQTILPDEAYLIWTNSAGEPVRSLNMPGYLGGAQPVVGTKIINGNIYNPKHGLPRASGLTLLYDELSARIVCLLEAAYLSSLRTASVTALAVDLLLGADFHTAAVIGAGVLARAHIELLARCFAHLRQVYLFDISDERAMALQHDLAPLLQEHGIILQRVLTAEEAIRAAQLIIPVTTTTTGYIPFAWLQPGSLLVNVSLDDPLPEVVLHADVIVVDDWNLVKHDHRRLLGRMYRDGLIVGPDDDGEVSVKGARRIDAQFGDIVNGTKTGRRHANDIILVNPFGLAIEDVALAAQVYQMAQALGIGMHLAY
jgi:N-[(2S)-2-amino-2-carboxyethyl]-L-glutamate dehydrogenase